MLTRRQINLKEEKEAQETIKKANSRPAPDVEIEDSRRVRPRLDNNNVPDINTVNSSSREVLQDAQILRKTVISTLEDNINTKCNNAIEMMKDIKNILADHNTIKSNENINLNQPSFSKNIIQNSPSSIKEEKVTISDVTKNDNDLPPDVSAFFANINAKSSMAAAARKAENERRASLHLRINQFDQKIKLNKLSAIPKVIKSDPDENDDQNSDSPDSDEENEENYQNEDEDEDEDGSKNGVFGDLLKAFSSTNSATAQGLHNLQDVLSRCPDESEFADEPVGLTVNLMLHQKKALKWMIFRENEESCPGGILADDMGLGKTLTMISLILNSMPLEKRKSSTYEVDSADSDDDWDQQPSKNKSGSSAFIKNSYDGGTLVVCPPTLLQQWKNEIRKHTNRGIFSVEVYHGSNRKRNPQELSRPDIVITTYSLLHLDSHIFNKVYWKRVVLDEAHQIRNYKTNISKAACLLKSQKRWALTGTPVHNKSLDIYAILKFLGCKPWDDIGIWNTTMRGARSGIVRLTALLKSVVLRRTKAELQASGEMPPLPPKLEKTFELELDEAETQVYKTLLAYSRTLFTQFLMQRNRRQGIYTYSLDMAVHRALKNKGNRPLSKDDIPSELFDELNKVLLNAKGDIQQFHILVLLLRLRQICNHPALISKMIDEEEISQGGLDEDSTKIQKNLFSKSLISKKSPYGCCKVMSENPMRSDNPVFQEDYESSKMKSIMQTLEEVLPTGDKIIIVSQWTCMLEVIERHISQTGETRYAMFTGKVKVSERQGIVDRFNNPMDDLKILLLSLTAGGVGLNLFGGNHLIMVDNHWNPQLEKQAEDRIYRYGQKKKVTIYKFLCKDTIEGRVKELQDRKLQLASDILTGLRLTSTRLTLDDLKQLFQIRN